MGVVCLSILSSLLEKNGLNNRIILLLEYNFVFAAQHDITFQKSESSNRIYVLPTAAPVKQVEASRGAGLELPAPWNQRSTACVRLGLVASPQFPDSSRCLGRSRPVVTWQRHHSIVHHRALCGCQQLANTSPSLCPPIIHAIINLLYRATLPAQLGFRWNYGKKLRLCIHLPNERGSPTGSVSYFDWFSKVFTFGL